jgi:hypothetical protein
MTVGTTVVMLVEMVSTVWLGTQTELAAGTQVRVVAGVVAGATVAVSGSGSQLVVVFRYMELDHGAVDMAAGVEVATGVEEVGCSVAVTGQMVV